MNLTQMILTDFVTRIRESTLSVCANLTEKQSTYRLDRGANTIAWLLWHSARVIDAQLHAMIGGDQLWNTWRGRLSLQLPPERLGVGETGYAQACEDAAALTAPIESLKSYLLACCDELYSYLATINDDALRSIIDESYDPPVSMGVRVVSIIDDCIQHLGQAAYLKGIVTKKVD